jgi:hypothetical protein
MMKRRQTKARANPRRKTRTTLKEKLENKRALLYSAAGNPKELQRISDELGILITEYLRLSSKE